jgi:predicted GTPase
VVDSRGIFETSPPGGAPTPDATRALRDAMVRYRPDVVLHVVSMREVRALANDLLMMADIMEGLRAHTGGDTPLVVVLSKPDIIGNPREWPPERYSRKAAQIKEALDYFVSDALRIRAGYRPLDLNMPYRGYELEPNERNVFCVVPVFALEDEPAWNVETLVQAIGERLPKSARLDFYQAQQRKEFLRRLSDSVIKRFAAIATAVGSSPIPVADIAVLTPLQLMVIAVIAGLSCRQLSLGSATQYLTAAGINMKGLPCPPGLVW